MTRINQHRTNPSKAISSFKGRWDSVFAWPSTAVSTWLNGGLFGGASWAAIDGGTEVLYTGYQAEKFTSSGTLTVSAAGYAEVLVVAGGGGGASWVATNQGGGGGGGGGVRAQSADLNDGADGNVGITGWVLLEAGDYTVSVGAGGAGGYHSSGSQHSGADGTQSYLQAPSGTPFNDGTSATAYMRAGPGAGGTGGSSPGRSWNTGSPTGIVAATGGSGGGGGQGGQNIYAATSGGTGGGTIGNDGANGGYYALNNEGPGGSTLTGLYRAGGGGGAAGNAGGGSSYWMAGGDPTEAYTTTQWEGTTKFYGGGGGGHGYHNHDYSEAHGSKGAGGVRWRTSGSSYGALDQDIAGSGSLSSTEGTMYSDEDSASANNTGSGGWGRGNNGIVGNGIVDHNTNYAPMFGRANGGGGGGGSGKGTYGDYAGDGGSGIVIVRVAV
jgi:hypothetical protein